MKPSNNFWITLTETHRVYLNILKRRHHILSCERRDNTIMVCSSALSTVNPEVIDRLEYRLAPTHYKDSTV